MLILTLETSCDETAAAVLRDGRDVLSDVVASQVEIHAGFGGVVPEIASRKHLEAVPFVVRKALADADVRPEDLEGIGVTRGPGLVGALLVGVSVAKAMAWSLGIPLVGLHHMEGHILAIQLEQEVPFPYLALAVSGGHTHLYRVEGIGRYETLGRTLDDAAGEAFDKVAKMLDLPYPGGAEIDRLAASGNPRAHDFPRPLLRREGSDFSFSGIKTAFRNRLTEMGIPDSQEERCDLAASFQAAVVEVLVAKTLRQAQASDLKRVVVSGGVACNRGLRRAFAEESERLGLDVFIPRPSLCSDNAAMLGVAADHYLTRGGGPAFDLNALANWPLGRALESG